MIVSGKGVDIYAMVIAAAHQVACDIEADSEKLVLLHGMRLKDDASKKQWEVAVRAAQSAARVHSLLMRLSRSLNACGDNHVELNESEADLLSYVIDPDVDCA